MGGPQILLLCSLLQLPPLLPSKQLMHCWEERVENGEFFSKLECLFLLAPLYFLPVPVAVSIGLGLLPPFYKAQIQLESSMVHTE